MQTFTAPLNTTYKIECWGASGGNTTNGSDGEGTFYTNTVYGGKGGYCLGMVALPYNLNLYVYVGQSGEGTTEYTFNGGGKGGSFFNGKSGGGATDVRLFDENGTWRNFNSLKSRIIVAAGGGGADHYCEGNYGGNAGGLSGENGFYYLHLGNAPYSVAIGATQNSGGKGGKGSSYYGSDGIFGSGGDSDLDNKGSGGGGGYYGGGGGGHNFAIVGSGAGGSSFISGYTGCDAIDESSTEDNIIPANLIIIVDMCLRIL